MKENYGEKIQNLRLNPRLQKIAELIPPCKSLADIGTDHAYIPLFAVLDGKAKRAVASDIKLGPVARAAENIKKFGLESEIIVRLGPGLATVSPDEAEVIVIAGMGGMLIADILEQAKEVVKSAKLLILQPMTAAMELRDYLGQNDFDAREEYLAAEEDKLYNIILAVPGGKTVYTEKERLLGKGLDKTSPELFPEYITRLESKLKKRIEGLHASKLEENTEKAKEIERLLELIRG